MNYLVLSRRYRPQLFQSVIGQETILTILKNGMRHNRVAHAYLFCGSRGTGKTTLARLFAKALNCEGISPAFEPCNQCSSCLDILSGQSLNVIEIDGASNRGIDDIRQIHESIGYIQDRYKYKIYIIDEVHMLTKEAFNALLKTLESPPQHVKFFFCTTEPHKILPTIVSRCQRFDLHSLNETEIIKKLRLIVQDLQKEISEEALHLIASYSEGSLRDAEALLDQVLCLEDGAITLQHVRSILGLVPEELFYSLDNAFHKGEIAFAFELVSHLFEMGKDLIHFVEQLIQYYRRLTQIKITPQQAVTLPESIRSNTIYAVEIYTEGQLLFILDLLLSGLNELKKSSLPRASLEILLSQIIRSKNRIPSEILVRRLIELEQKLTLQPQQTNIIESQSTQKNENPITNELPPNRPKTALKPTFYYETLLRFAAVELEGTVKTGSIPNVIENQYK